MCNKNIGNISSGNDSKYILLGNLIQKVQQKKKYKVNVLNKRIEENDYILMDEIRYI